MPPKNAPEFTVRVLSRTGETIASFRGEPGDSIPGLSPELHSALVAFREAYPQAHFIDVEFP